MSTTLRRSPRQRLSNLFHRRDRSHDTLDSPPPSVSSSAPSPVVATGPPAQSHHVQKMSSIRSLRDKFQQKVTRKPSVRQRPSSGPQDPFTGHSTAAQIAAATALQQDYGDRSAEGRSEPSFDLSSISIHDDHDLAFDPNQWQIHNQQPVIQQSPNSNSPSNAHHQVEDGLSSIRLVDDPSSEGTKFHDIDQGYHDRPAGRLDNLHTPLKTEKSYSIDNGRDSPVSPVSRTSTNHSLSHKSDYADLRNSARGGSSPTLPMRSIEREWPSIKRSSLEKPLPETPDSAWNQEDDSAHSMLHDSAIHSEIGRERGYLVKDAEHPVDLDGIVDLNDTEDTTLYEHYAPAVTHETITHEVHEIREEVITREIHNHHIHHRILPIIDVEVLPARHFVPVEGGGLAEISEKDVPGCSIADTQQAIAEAMSKQLPQSGTTSGPRQFSARAFEGTDGDYNDYITAEGFPRTETTWVHPPRVETGGQVNGQTQPFYFGSTSSQNRVPTLNMPSRKAVPSTSDVRRPHRS